MFQSQNQVQDIYNESRVDNIVDNNENDAENDIQNSKLIFRYKFTQDFMDHLHNFSKIHEFEDRIDFKESWKNWMEENNDIVKNEVNRLNSLNYKGDIIDKMFKSARYYFRKKSNLKQEPKKRRQYISVSNELLKMMDHYIKNNIVYPPKKAFIMFCKDNEEIVKNSIHKIMENGCNDLKLIENKIKKTYDNRYYTLTTKGTICKSI
jgi:hypothetical protein